MWWWQNEGANVVEKSFLEEFGTLVRWSGALGVRCFLKSQLKAILLS
jgi:hypothetical protein